MRLRTMQATTLLLLGSTLSLGAFLFSTRNALPTQTLVERDALLLPAFRPGDIRRLRIHRPSTQKETLFIKAVADGRLDGFHLDALDGPLAEEASLIAYLELLEYAKPVSRAPFPATGAIQLEVEIEDVRGKTRLQFFEPRADGLVPVVRVEPAGKPAGFEVRAALYESLDKPRGHFLPRQLFPFSERATQKLRLVGKNQVIELESRADGFYVGETRADRDLVSGIFFQLGRAEMSELLDDQVAEANVGQSHAIVEQTAIDGQMVRVEFGGPCPLGEAARVVAIRRTGGGLSGCVDSSVLALFASTPSDLQDLHLTSLKSDELDHFVLQNGEQSYDLIRKDDAFELRNGEARSFETARAERFFRVLAETRASPLPLPLVQPFTKEGTLRLVGHGPADVVIDETLEFMNHGGEVWFRRGDGMFLGVGDGTLSRLVLHPDAALADPRILPFPLDSMVELRHRSERGDFILTKTEEQFLITESGKKREEPADADGMQKLMKALSGLETHNWLTPEEARASPNTSPLKAELELTFKFSTSTNPVVLEVFEHRAGGYRARVSSESMDFVLDAANVQELSRVPLSRQDVLWPEAVAGVNVRLDLPDRQPTRLRLEKQGEQWHKSEGSSSLEGEELVELLKALTPNLARPELRKEWTRWKKPRLTVEIRTADGASSELRYFDVPDALSFQPARLVVVSPDNPLPFEVDASSFEHLVDTIE